MEAIFSRQTSELYFILMVLSWGITILLHIIFAAGVARDAGKLMRGGAPTTLVGPMVWVFATLLGGVFVTAAYWLIHHSTLRGEKVWSQEY
jgi:hypothetical protein